MNTLLIADSREEADAGAEAFRLTFLNDLWVRKGSPIYGYRANLIVLWLLDPDVTDSEWWKHEVICRCCRPARIVQVTTWS